jgi:hypothetical protein
MHKQLDIETALRAPEPQLADDEFSANVLASLPPPRRRRRAARRWTLAGAAGLGSALTLLLAPPLEGVVASLSPVAVPPLVISTVAVLAIVTIPVVFVFYAARGER